MVDPVFAPGWPFVLRPAPTGQYPVAIYLVDSPLGDLDLVADLALVLPPAVLVLLLAWLHPVPVLALLLLGLVPVPLPLLVLAQVVVPPAFLHVVANWEVPGLPAGLQRAFMVVLPLGILPLLLDFQQYATEMIIPDFLYWCPGFIFQVSV